MEITEARVKLADIRSEKLKAFATVTFDDCFVVRDIKVILGARGLFVAMPSRRLDTRCPRCRCKNHLRAQYCNECGGKLSQGAEQLDDRGRAKLRADIAHPINKECRSLLQKAILEAYREEVGRSTQAGDEPPSSESGDEIAEDVLPEDAAEEVSVVAEVSVEDEEIAEPADDVNEADEAPGPSGGEPSEGPSEPSGDESEDERSSDDEDSEAGGNLGIFG